jgi:hypothetical protein
MSLFKFDPVIAADIVDGIIARAREFARESGNETAEPDPDDQVLLLILAETVAATFNKALESITIDPQFVETCSIELLEHASVQLAEKMVERSRAASAMVSNRPSENCPHTLLGVGICADCHERGNE